jgi:putative oxidoreductase
MSDKKDLSPLLLRVALGLVFILPGLSKFTNPDMIIGMLAGLGFPAASLLGWILLLSEIGFGSAVLAGYKTKYTIWPLVVILVVALFKVTLPELGTSPMAMITVLWHVLGIATLVSIYYTGPGSHAIKG